MSKTTILLLFISAIVFLILFSLFFGNSNKNTQTKENSNQKFWNNNKYDEHHDHIFVEDE